MPGAGICKPLLGPALIQPKNYPMPFRESKLEHRHTRAGVQIVVDVLASQPPRFLVQVTLEQNPV